MLNSLFEGSSFAIDVKIRFLISIQSRISKSKSEIHVTWVGIPDMKYHNITAWFSLTSNTILRRTMFMQSWLRISLSNEITRVSKHPIVLQILAENLLHSPSPRGDTISELYFYAIASCFVVCNIHISDFKWIIQLLLIGVRISSRWWYYSQINLFVMFTVLALISFQFLCIFSLTIIFWF